MVSSAVYLFSCDQWDRNYPYQHLSSLAIVKFMYNFCAGSLFMQSIPLIFASVWKAEYFGISSIVCFFSFLSCPLVFFIPTQTNIIYVYSNIPLEALNIAKRSPLIFSPRLLSFIFIVASYVVGLSSLMATLLLLSEF